MVRRLCTILAAAVNATLGAVPLLLVIRILRGAAEAEVLWSLTAERGMSATVAVS